MELGPPDYIVLVVEDVERSLAFYVDTLGLPLGHRSGPYAQLDTGRTRIALYERTAMAETLRATIDAPDTNAPGFEIGFKVPDVDEAFGELLEAGVPAVCEPTDRPWGQRTAYVRDPDGYLIELVEELEGRLA